MFDSNKLKGAIYGHLLGDACGVPYEFNKNILPISLIDMVPPPDYKKSHSKIPIGYWSDDGAQMLILLENLIENGHRFNPKPFANNLVRWFDYNYMCPNGVGFGSGSTTREAIANIKRGVELDKCGPNTYDKNGNGSLMRVLPLGLLFEGTDFELISTSFQQSQITHGHIVSGLCCAWYSLWVRYTKLNISDPFENAFKTLYDELPYARMEIAKIALDGRITGSGFVVDTLKSAKWASEQGSFENCIKSAISLGLDADSTASCTGGIVGLKEGFDKLPTRWISLLEGKELVENLLGKLNARI